MSGKCFITWLNDTYVKFTGVIDETVRFQETVAKFGSEVHLDFSGVTRINSCGVREWVRAVHNCKSLLRYVCAPALLVEQFSLIPEFLGAKGTVESFDAPYICDACGNEEVILLTVGKDIFAGLAEYPDGPKRNCSKCGTVLEFEHNPEIYLEFLKSMKP